MFVKLLVKAGDDSCKVVYVNPAFVVAVLAEGAVSGRPVIRTTEGDMVVAGASSAYEVIERLSGREADFFEPGGPLPEALVSLETSILPYAKTATPNETSD